MLVDVLYKMYIYTKTQKGFFSFSLIGAVDFICLIVVGWYLSNHGNLNGSRCFSTIWSNSVLPPDKTPMTPAFLNFRAFRILSCDPAGSGTILHSAPFWFNVPTNIGRWLYNCDGARSSLATNTIRQNSSCLFVSTVSLAFLHCLCNAFVVALIPMVIDFLFVSLSSRILHNVDKISSNTSRETFGHLRWYGESSIGRNVVRRFLSSVLILAPPTLPIVDKGATSRYKLNCRFSLPNHHILHYVKQPPGAPIIQFHAGQQNKGKRSSRKRIGRIVTDMKRNNARCH